MVLKRYNVANGENMFREKNWMPVCNHIYSFGSGEKGLYVNGPFFLAIYNVAP